MNFQTMTNNLSNEELYMLGAGMLAIASLVLAMMGCGRKHSSSQTTTMCEVSIQTPVNQVEMVATTLKDVVSLRDVLLDTMIVRHFTSDGDEARAVYDASSRKLHWNGVSFDTPSGFAKAHQKERQQHTGRQSTCTNGWTDCQTCFDGAWVKLSVLRKYVQDLRA